MLFFHYVHDAFLSCESYRRYQLTVGRCCLQCGNNTQLACATSSVLKYWCVKRAAVTQCYCNYWENMLETANGIKLQTLCFKIAYVVSHSDNLCNGRNICTQTYVWHFYQLNKLFVSRVSDRWNRRHLNDLASFKRLNLLVFLYKYVNWHRWLRHCVVLIIVKCARPLPQKETTAARFPKTRTRWSRYLRPLACWDCGFEFFQLHRWMSLMNVVWCKWRPLRRADPLSRGVLPIVYVLFSVVMWNNTSLHLPTTSR